MNRLFTEASVEARASLFMLNGGEASSIYSDKRLAERFQVPPDWLQKLGDAGSAAPSPIPSWLKADPAGSEALDFLFDETPSEPEPDKTVVITPLFAKAPQLLLILIHSQALDLTDARGAILESLAATQKWYRRILQVPAAISGDEAAITRQILEESRRRHSEWISLMVLDPKNLVKVCIERYGADSAESVATLVKSLVAGMLRQVGCTASLRGGRLLLAYFGHSPCDVELLGGQMGKTLHSAYRQAATEPDEPGVEFPEPTIGTAHQVAVDDETEGELAAYLSAVQDPGNR